MESESALKLGARRVGCETVSWSIGRPCPKISEAVLWKIKKKSGNVGIQHATHVAFLSGENVIFPMPAFRLSPFNFSPLSSVDFGRFPEFSLRVPVHWPKWMTRPEWFTEMWKIRRECDCTYQAHRIDRKRTDFPRYRRDYSTFFARALQPETSRFRPPSGLKH